MRRPFRQRGPRPRTAAGRRPWGRAARALLPMGLGLLLLAASPPAGPAGPPAQDSGGPVVVATRVDHAITPIIEDHLQEVVADAERADREAVVVEIDTPGGLDTAMRGIVQSFLDAEVPVVVYVTPSGARAASAGALIAWSSNVVAMAPGTTIGAATPVDLEGGEVGDKIVEDAAAYARAVAEERGRDIEVAAEAVTEGRALSSSEAVDEGVADLIAANRTALLEALDGRQVTVAGGTTVTLRTAEASVTEQQLTPFRRLLQWLADPNLAFLFMSLGTLGIIYELATPGIGAAGGLGVVMILLALLALAVLPIAAVGVVFLLVAMALFAAELFAPGIGVAAALGSLSLVLAGLLLFRDDAPGLELSLAAVVPTAAVVGLAVILAGRLALRARTAPSAIGVPSLVGQQVTVARASGTSGQALVDGAWWTVHGDRPLEAGERVRVREVQGLDLLVEDAPSEDAPTDEDPPRQDKEKHS